MPISRKEDSALMIRAEAKCTGADVHLVRTVTCLLDGKWELKKEKDKSAKKFRRVLQAYLNGTPIRKAYNEVVYGKTGSE